MSFIRSILGKIILTYEALFSPKGPKRSPEEQRRIDQEAAPLALYQFKACPFCVKVRFTLKRLGLNIQLRDAKNNETYKKELIEQGGKLQVPCLRIQKEDGSLQWIYESDAIVAYLHDQFGIYARVQ